MKLSPRARANIVSFAVLAPYFLAGTVYRAEFTQRTFAYLTLGAMLVSMLVHQWVYHRHAGPAAASALPRAELLLSPDPLPRVAWVGLLPPVIVSILLWWVARHGDALPWRDNWLGAPTPAWDHKMFMPLAMGVIAWNSVVVWKVVEALGRWYGMSRAYPHRSRRLRVAVGTQWAALLTSVCWATGNTFYLPGPWPTLCALGFGGGMFLFLQSAGAGERMRKAQPATGSWYYLDSRDPSFLSPRGLNVANAWTWLLAAAAAAPILLMEWLYQYSRAIQ